MSIYSQAKQFVDMGIAIFPIKYRAKTPAVPSWQIYQTHLPTEAELKKWFPSQLRNYGIVMGWQRICTLDFDTMDAFYQWQAWTIDNTKALDNAYMSKTSRGMHIVFTLLETLPNIKFPDCDFKTSGYIVGAGSTHPSGHIYKSMRPLNFPIVEKLSDVLPAEIYEQATDAQDIKPINPPGESLPTLPGSLSVWDEAEQGTLFDDLSPIEKVKKRWRIENFFPGEKPDHSGFLHVTCPFHQDKNPSAWVDTHNQLFGCHRCNMKPMTVIGFYAALHQMDIKSAIREMLK